jgi:hypothetical protein
MPTGLDLSLLLSQVCSEGWQKSSARRASLPDPRTLTLLCTEMYKSRILIRVRVAFMGLARCEQRGQHCGLGNLILSPAGQNTSFIVA